MRQEAYLRALRSTPGLEIIYGHFVTRPAWRRLADGSGSVEILRTEEKGSDVNLATHLVADAFRGVFDLAVVICNDSDLCEAVRIVTQEAGQRVGILLPIAKRPKSRSRQLCDVATFWRPIRTSGVKASQLEDTITVEGGTVTRPDRWR